MVAGIHKPSYDNLKLSFHRQSLHDNASDSDTQQRQLTTCLGHLGRCDIDRIISIYCCTAQFGQAKY
jgi:hypothetical protein